MTETNLIAKEVQSLEVPDSIVYLFELEYTSSTTLYFHPGVSPDVQVTSVSGSTIKLNRAQTFTDNAQLTFTGVNNNTGAEYTITANVNGTVSSASHSVNIDGASTPSSADGVTGTIIPGMKVTGSDITEDGYGPIVFDGNTYYGFPIHVTGIDMANDGAMNRPTLTMANVESILLTDSTFQNAFNSTSAEGGSKSGLSGFTIDSLIGKRIVRRSTLDKYLTIDTATTGIKSVIEFPKSTYIVDRVASKDSIMVTFELAAPYDLAGIRVPRREVIGKYCSWMYQGLKDFTTGSNLTGTVYTTSGSLSTLRSATSTNFFGIVTKDDEIIIDGMYIRRISDTVSDGDTTLTLSKDLPVISNNSNPGGNYHAGPVTYAKITRNNKGACSWRINSVQNIGSKYSNLDHSFFVNVNDEPVIFKGLTHTYSGGSWTIRNSSQAVNGLYPKQWSGTSTPATSLSLTKNDIVYTNFTRDSGDELLWIYLGATGTVSQYPEIGSSLWQLIRTYTKYTDRVYTTNPNNEPLRNEYVVYPVAEWSTDTSIDLVDVSRLWRNTYTISTANGIAPADNSTFWEQGDVCGKLLKSCKARYQAQPRYNGTAVPSGTQTIPAVEKDTNRLLPFGGFPGSRKFR